VGVIQPDPVIASSNVAEICLGGQVTLNASYVQNFNTYTYTWAGSTASGLDPNNNTGESITVQPTAAGVYTYSLTGYDSEFGCAAGATVSVLVRALPNIDSVRTTNASICAGSTTTLNAYSSSLSGGSSTLPTGYSSSSATSTADDEIFNVTITGTSLNNTSNCSTVAPGPGSAAALYSNFTTSVAAPTITAGNTINGSVTIGQCLTTAYTTGYAIFIDLNRDGIFQSNEKVYNQTNATSAVAGTVKPFTFVLPSTATSGLTLMRIVAVESTAGASINPTGTYTWGETEDYAVNIIGQVLANPSYTYIWNPGSASGASVNVTPAATTDYYVTVTDDHGCVKTSTSPLTITVNAIPSAPIGVDSVQCGVGVPRVSVTSADNTVSPTFNWYSTPTTPQTITYYNNNFNTTNTAAIGGAVLSGSATLTGSAVQLTPNTTSSLGGLTIPSSGINGQTYNVQFNLITGGGGGADGLSYSFAPDADATASTPNAETGTGTKLKISFDDYGSGAGASGIRLIYGNTISDPGTTVGTNNVLAYSSDVSWVGANVPVIANINANGKLKLTVNGTTIFNNVQLPSDFMNSDKSSWTHVFKARTGALAMVHAID
jgi:hypothetical protein